MQVQVGNETVSVKLFYERKQEQVRYNKMSSGFRTVTSFTGRTVAVIWDGDKRYIGISQCAAPKAGSKVKRVKVTVSVDGVQHSVSLKSGQGDSFNKALGKQIAIARALFARALDQRISALQRGKTHIVRNSYGKHYGTVTTTNYQANALVRGIPEELLIEVRRDGRKEDTTRDERVQG